MIPRNPNNHSHRYMMVCIKSDIRLAIHDLRNGAIAAFTAFTSDEARQYPVAVENACSDLDVTPREFRQWESGYTTHVATQAVQITAEVVHSPSEPAAEDKGS